MASIIWLFASFVAGIGLYVLFPISVMQANVRLRQRVGKPYLKMGARSLKQFAFVRRVLSGYDLLGISVDNEQKLLETTLSSSTMGEDEEYRFNDPDNRIKRLWNKPMSLNFELIPAAVDAELAELGHWIGEKRTDEGLWDGDREEDYENVTVDPYVTMSDGLRLVDPIDVFELTPSDIDPENIKTVEAHTKSRFSKYGSKVTLTDILAVLMGFAVGMIGMAGGAWIRQRMLDGGGGGGGISNPVDDFSLQLADPAWLTQLADPAWMDMVVTLL